MGMVSGSSGPGRRLVTPGPDSVEFADSTRLQAVMGSVFLETAMYAVIETGGKQYRVAVGDVVRVEKLAAPVGSAVRLDRVLMLGEGEGVRIGNPHLGGTAVTATIKAHGRGPKIRVFKMRRRKHFRKTTGHRQDYTDLEITAIGA
jgi:large subunit ribosomal protein L21